ncbi:hypothetical protein Tco_0180045 [Tanacetum coccineum]
MASRHSIALKAFASSRRRKSTIPDKEFSVGEEFEQLDRNSGEGLPYATESEKPRTSCDLVQIEGDGLFASRQGYLLQLTSINATMVFKKPPPEKLKVLGGMVSKLRPQNLQELNFPPLNGRLLAIRSGSVIETVR